VIPMRTGRERSKWFRRKRRPADHCARLLPPGWK
jgi:hypothetical protein